MNLFSRRAVKYRLAFSQLSKLLVDWGLGQVLSLATGLEHVSSGVRIAGIAAAQQKILSHSLLKGCDIAALSNLIGSELSHKLFLASRLSLLC